MGAANKKQELRLKRKARIRKKIAGTPERPRLSIFRSARHIYAQLIDDTKGVTFVTASSNEPDVKNNTELSGKNKSEVAVFVGKLIAGRAKDKGISSVVFDRGGFVYHGRVKAVSDGAREGGLNF
ncbi:50S ribosomal protein L18 [Desulfosudis oleivorans]|uniref:Large ribosomal subunit protein uL18 n=1 Tax=Desulfosudis oleivorans (strain DSM 6200 / JCM 39069 / Hxd3) TaxID=96561 RepID=RL18_DESOH|nr:50S ribosomal protein L18 [Desulfosudis oleivorans]A8ZV73.1 RecName: Full=Large ribosomal subunit protein uL18; AltName: Full=50S ribosomal protein L18 [Desulfosudis oleivorans Hxd3]ABW66534.1 ribosomal protein L18 [Desulfosudis oleivorans Hxd3]